MVTYAITVTGSGRRNVQLRAVNAGGSGSHAVDSTDVPAAPSRLRASLAGSSVSLSWDDPGDDSIDSYWYRIKKAGAGNAYSLPIEISGSGASTTSATISVTGEGRRIVELQARPAIHPGWGARYKSAAASTGPPAQPSGFRIPGGSYIGGGWPEVVAPASSPKGEVDFHWSDPGDDSIVKYRYHLRPARPGTLWSKWIDIPGSGASTTSHKFVLPTSEPYRFRLQAVNGAGVGHNSIRVRASWPAPAVPSGLEAALSGSSVSLSWDNPYDSSIGKYQYRIKTAGAANAYGSWTDIAGSNSGTTSATITVTGSGRRIVQLRADGSGPSNPASASTGPPAQPSGFRIPGGSYIGGGWPEVVAPASSPKGEVDFHWSDPGDDSIVKYRYHLRPARPGTLWSKWIDIPGSGASTTSHKFVLPTSEPYRFRLQAVNGAGVGHNSIRVRASWPAPAVPSGLEAALSGSSVSLSWDNPYDSSIGKYQYRIKTAGAANAYGSWTDIAGSNSGTTSATITVTGSERRIVQLRADGSGPSNPASASTGPPAPPSGFTTPATKGTYRSTDEGYVVVTAATSLPKGEVVVSWSDPGDDSIIKYQYNFRPADTSDANNSRWIDIPGSGASTTSHTFVMPTPQSYRVRVRAVAEVGTVDQIVHVKPSWPAPSAPTGLKATLSGNSVSLSWDNPYDDSIQGYEYRIKTVGAGNSYSDWTDIADSAIVGGGAPTLSTTIAVTGSGNRSVELRAFHHNDVGGPGSPATASTE